MALLGKLGLWWFVDEVLTLVRSRVSTTGKVSGSDMVLGRLGDSKARIRLRFEESGSLSWVLEMPLFSAPIE